MREVLRFLWDVVTMDYPRDDVPVAPETPMFLLEPPPANSYNTFAYITSPKYQTYWNFKP